MEGNEEKNLLSLVRKKPGVITKKPTYENGDMDAISRIAENF